MNQFTIFYNCFFSAGVFLIFFENAPIVKELSLIVFSPTKSKRELHRAIRSRHCHVVTEKQRRNWSQMINTYKFIFTLVIAVIIAGCRSVPFTDRTQLMLTTSGYENNLGVEAYAEYKAKYKRSTNSEYNQALARCGKAIAKASGADDFDWQFTVLETNVQNAFCLPGGKVAVYSGIMRLMRNEAELAFVVAHEVGHAIARHGGERLSWGYLQSLGGILVEAGLNNKTASEVYGVGTNLGVMLPFSRSNEAEADTIGLILMAKAGYNPHAAVHFWTRFSSNSSADMLGNLLRTHPCDADRIAAMNNNMPLAEQEYKITRNKKGFGMTFSHSGGRK